MIILIEIENVACWEDHSDFALMDINPDYVDKIPVALEAWRSYYNYKRGLLKYEDQMFYEGHYIQSNLPEYQHFILENLEDFEDVLDFDSELENFVKFFNYFYPDAKLDFVKRVVHYEIDINE